MLLQQGKLRPQKRAGWDTPCVNFLPQSIGDGQTAPRIRAQTVHGVKGETHDVTIFVCPHTTAAHCPFTVWWSTGERDREEKRITYVAMTRARGGLDRLRVASLLRASRCPTFCIRGQLRVHDRSRVRRFAGAEQSLEPDSSN